jgi:serine/threonine protein phosphatase PrpC
MKEAARWIGVGRTEIGYARQSNQDVFATINSCNFWIVADGMGGHPAGDLAAHIAVDVATEQVKELVPTINDTPEIAAKCLGKILMKANQVILEKVRAEPSLKGMGTTVVAMTIAPAPTPVAHIAHLGDSRAYRFRAGALTQLTRDHTLVAMLLQRGLINEATARTYPDRHILTKGLGMESEMEPELTSVPLTNEDLLVLCSDGLTKMLDDADIASILTAADGNASRACHDLVELALSRGGEDNVTVIVCAHTTPDLSESLAIDKIPPAM